jgi:hypothetical protein
MSIHYIHFFFTDGKFGGSSKLGSGEGKQVFGYECGEDVTATCESKLIFLLAIIAYFLALEMSGPSST